MTKSDLVRKHITEFPNVKSKKERARMLVELYPERFKDLEDARSILRSVTGSRGEQIRKNMPNPKLQKFFYNGFEKWAEQNLNTAQRPWDEPFIIPTSIKQLNIIADLHSVHLDHKVLELFLRSTKDKEAVLLNGDLMDSESLSRHLKGHNVIEYEKEIELSHKILKGLKEEFTHVYFKEGNHSAWLTRYLLTNAREVFRLLGIELKDLLRVGELGIHHIHNLTYINYGDLDIIHGHEMAGGSFGMGKFPARGYVDKWQTFKKQYEVKIFASHCHRIDEWVSPRSKDNKFGYGYVGPCMCRKGAQFNPYAGWDNGWATATLNSDNKAEIKVIVV